MDNEFDPSHIAQSWIDTLGQLRASTATADQQDKVTIAKAFLQLEQSLKTIAELPDATADDLKTLAKNALRYT